MSACCERDVQLQEYHRGGFAMRFRAIFPCSSVVPSRVRQYDTMKYRWRCVAPRIYHGRHLQDPWGQLQLGSNLNCRVVDLLRLTLAMTLHCPGSVGILSIAATKSDPTGWGTGSKLNERPPRRVLLRSYPSGKSSHLVSWIVPHVNPMSDHTPPYE